MPSSRLPTVALLPPGSPCGGAAGQGCLDWYGDGRVAVVDLGLACCGIESEMATPPGARRLAEVPEGAQVVVVASGTLTDALAPLMAARIAELPGAHVISFGACACAGGPYWDSYSVTKGIDQLVEVHTWIAGCPPPPEALASAIDALARPVPA